MGFVHVAQMAGGMLTAALVALGVFGASCLLAWCFVGRVGSTGNQAIAIPTHNTLTRKAWMESAMRMEKVGGGVEERTRRQAIKMDGMGGRSAFAKPDAKQLTT